jgi:peptidoglycan LD-endopeptidase LytH
MIRVFPIAGPTSFVNDWGAGRGHQGNDLHAHEGAPIVAVDDGTLRSGTDPLGGNVVNLHATDGTRYYYAHLSSFAALDGARLPYAPAPRTVRTGDLVGFVGRTGNAAQTDPHVHFEMHPGGGAAVNPYDALVAAPRVTPNQLRAPSGAPGPLRAVLLIGLATTAAWLLLNPSASRRLTRRLGIG